MSGMDRFIHSKQTEDLMKDPDKLEKLRNAPETQRIFTMLSQSTGQDLEQASREDPTRLISAIRKLMQDPEGSQLIQKMKERLE